jgi:charged multivesicular body protein 6
MTNADEDEVEDELAALEAEMAGPERLPSVPDTRLPEQKSVEAQAEMQPAPAKQREREMIAA